MSRANAKNIEKVCGFCYDEGKEVRQRANLPFALPLFCVFARRKGKSGILAFFIAFVCCYAILAISRANLSLLVSKSNISLG